MQLQGLIDMPNIGCCNCMISGKNLFNRNMERE